MPEYRITALFVDGTTRSSSAYNSRDAAYYALMDFQGDLACVLAEVEEWADAEPGMMRPITIVHQAERTYRPDLNPPTIGEWVTSRGADLRCRTRGGEAREKLEGYADGRP